MDYLAQSYGLYIAYLMTEELTHQSLSYTEFRERLSLPLTKVEVTKKTEE